MATFVQLLKTSASLRRCYLSDVTVQNVSVGTIFHALVHNTTLQVIGVSSVMFSIPDLRALERLLPLNCALHTLIITDNEINAEKAIILANALRNNKSLHSLIMTGNVIGDEGAAAFAEALKCNNTLIELGLGKNAIGIVGMKALALSLNQNRSLKDLILYQNNIVSNMDMSIAEDVFLNVLVKSNVSLVCLEGEFSDQSSAIKRRLDRNNDRIPAVAAQAACFLIGIRRGTNYAGMGDFCVFPKEIVKMIALQVWATRSDPVWLELLEY